MSGQGGEWDAAKERQNAALMRSWGRSFPTAPLGWPRVALAAPSR